MTRSAIKTAVMFAAAWAGVAFQADACPRQRFIRCLRERPRVSGPFRRRQAPRVSLSPMKSTLSKEMETGHAGIAGRAKPRAPATERRDPQVRRFALAGLMDVDNDGNSDLEVVRRLIIQNGGQIDAELHIDGRLIGKLRPDTQRIILGELPDKTAAAPEVAKQFDAFLRRASEWAIPVVRLKELLSRGSVRSSRSADPDAKSIFSADPDAKSIFQPRRPPRQPPQQPY